MRSLGRSVTEFKRGISEGSEDEEKKEEKKIENP
jgi:Sec-independent protein translocase protein TatA